MRVGKLSSKVCERLIEQFVQPFILQYKDKQQYLRGEWGRLFHLRRIIKSETMKNSKSVALIEKDSILSSGARNRENSSQKHVRIKHSPASQSGKHMPINVHSLQNIPSIDSDEHIDEISLCRDDQLSRSCHTIKSRQKKGILSSERKKQGFRSMKVISDGEGSCKNIKQSKSIKFNEKKDIFVYKSEKKLKGDNKKRRKSQAKGPTDDECCQLI